MCSLHMAAVGRAYIVARICVNTARKKILIHNFITKKYWNKNEKHFKNEQKYGCCCNKEQIQEEYG